MRTRVGHGATQTVVTVTRSHLLDSVAVWSVVRDGTALHHGLVRPASALSLALARAGRASGEWPSR